jgi:hypothetical protein
VTAREYVLSPLTRVSSSRSCSSNTRFVRFMRTVYPACLIRIGALDLLRVFIVGS